MEIKTARFKGFYEIRCPYCNSRKLRSLCSVRHGVPLGLRFTTLFKCELCGKFFVEVSEPEVWVREGSQETPIYVVTTYMGNLDELIDVVANAVLVVEECRDPFLINEMGDNYYTFCGGATWSCVDEEVKILVEDRVREIESEAEEEFKFEEYLEVYDDTLSDEDE